MLEQSCLTSVAKELHSAGQVLSYGGHAFGMWGTQVLCWHSTRCALVLFAEHTWPQVQLKRAHKNGVKTNFLFLHGFKHPKTYSTKYGHCKLTNGAIQNSTLQFEICFTRGTSIAGVLLL